MSTTAGIVKLNARRLMNDFPVGGTAPAVADETLFVRINSFLVQLSGDVGTADTWSSAAVPLVAGTRIYQLSSTAYPNLSLLRRHTDGRTLDRRSPEEIVGLYEGNQSSAGPVTDFALWEGADEKLNLDLYPTPDAAAVAANASLDAFLATAISAVTRDASTIAYSPQMASALELFVAAESIASFDPETLKQKRLAPTLAAALQARAERLVEQEKDRLATFQRQSVPVRVRF